MLNAFIAHHVQRGHALDAVRISDGEMVFLKRVDHKTHPEELKIAMLFNSEPLKSHPKNHCVPIFEVLDISEEEDKVILVMPLLCKFDRPRFDTVGEVVGFLEQVLQVSDGYATNSK